MGRPSFWPRIPDDHVDGEKKKKSTGDNFAGRRPHVVNPNRATTTHRSDQVAQTISVNVNSVLNRTYLYPYGRDPRWYNPRFSIQNCGARLFESQIQIVSPMSCAAVTWFLLKATGSLVLAATICLAICEAARPLVDVPFDALLPEHFRGLAIYALGLLHGALMLSGRKVPQETVLLTSDSFTATSEVSSTISTGPKDDEEVPPPPKELFPEESETPYPEESETPRTLLKELAIDMLNVAPVVHSPEIMTIDDYEAIKENIKGNKTPNASKSTTKRRKSIRTPKSVNRLSPS